MSETLPVIDLRGLSVQYQAEEYILRTYTALIIYPDAPRVTCKILLCKEAKEAALNMSAYFLAA